ncbi:hypothetical protein HMPREF9439_00690 [Parasutterella excrementihominis YIT 11859]|uniref:Uncharacterized protein n=1 Tax=Parasutterella excrementihominis YIT 11859 TaxID=762966 RepID=F3QIE3_9BURK|nr:hypothetical protein HMPREF9439_00690 [Parasutterella excrementihominis YIT 11859]
MTEAGSARLLFCPYNAKNRENRVFFGIFICKTKKKLIFVS